MLTRILTSVIGVAVFFAVLLSPAQLFGYAILVVTAVMLGEVYNVLKCGHFVNAVGYLSAVCVAAAVRAANGAYMLPALAACITFYLAAAVIMHGRKGMREVLAHGFLTVFLTAFMYHIMKLRLISLYAALWVFVIAWMTDTGAYFSGVFFGRHKLVPHISPKKTVEGAIGGVLLCAASSALYAYIISLLDAGEGKIAGYVLMGIVGSVLAQLGDFVASCIKRDCDVKDYGSILPGHGGLMDRFDSVVFIAPFVYYAVRLMNTGMMI